LHGELKPDGIKNILIPYGENIHTRLALEIAPALAGQFNCGARIVTVIDPASPPETREVLLSRIRDLSASTGLAAHVSVIHDKGVVRGIARTAHDTDLLLMGGRSGDLIGLLFRQSLTQEITDQVSCPVLWLIEYEERQSYWKLLFSGIGKETA
jgi:nucleotide-binding universal stress UspA family protein